MKHYSLISLLLCIISVHLTAADKNPYMLVIQGATSSEKTSLCKALQKQNPHLQHLDEDDIITDCALAILKETNASDLAIVKCAIEFSNIFHAIDRDEVCIKTNLSDEEVVESRKSLTILQQGLKNSNFHNKNKANLVRQSIIERIQQTFNAGTSIILDDHVFKTEELKNAFPNNPITFIRTAGSFDLLVKRNIKRNQEASDTCDFSNKRLYYYSLSSYFSRYELSLKPSDLAIAKTSVKDLNSNFETIKQDIMSKGSFVSPREHTVEDVENIQKEVMPNTDSPDDIVYIVPKEQSYDYILCTDNITPEQGAQKIMEFIGH